MAAPDTQQINWTPPPGYQQVDSGLAGILVYAPIPEAEKTEAPATFTCPNCGAATKFDVAAGEVACEHCGFIAHVAAKLVGRRAETFEFTLATLNQAQQPNHVDAQGLGVERRTLHCKNCGAEFAVEENALTTTCPFCASNQVDISAAAPVEQLRPRFLIPFKIQTAALRANAAAWLGKGWFHPADLSKSAVIDRFTGIYLPYWTFSASIAAAWKAEVGYERTVRHYNASTKTWESRVVIDWRWESGQAGLNISDLLVSGSSHVSRVILDKVRPFNLNELVTYAPDFLAGWQAHAYDVTLPAAWEQGKDAMREQAKKSCYAQIHSSHVRNFGMSADFADEAWRYILLPVYVAAYKFEEKVYQVMVNGQTGIVAGQKPVAWWKIWLVIGLAMAPGLLSGLVGLPLLLAGGVGLPVLFIAFILLVIGGIISYSVYRQAMASEAG